MKVYMKPVKMIAWFDNKGVATPIKFQFSDATDNNITVKVDRISLREEEKLAGNKMIVFRCQSIIDNSEKVYELKYEVSTMKWYLSKI